MKVSELLEERDEKRTVDVLLDDDCERPEQALLERRECGWIRSHNESVVPGIHSDTIP